MPRRPRRRPARRPRRRVRRVPRSPRTVGSQFAKCVEVKQYGTGDQPTLQANTLYQLQFLLQDCPRAMNIASQYRYMRLDKIELKWEPLYNVYNPDLGTAKSVPQLFYMVDRTGIIQSPVNALLYLQEQGVKPFRFISDVKRHLVPNINVISAIQQPQNDNLNFSQAFQTPKKLVWMNTHTGSGTNVGSDLLNKTTPWFGVKFLIDQLNTPGTISRFTIIYHWSFKDPFAPAAGEPTPA